MRRPSWLRQFKKRFVGHGTVAPVVTRFECEQLEDRSLLATAIWTGGGVAASGSAVWSDPRNWYAGYEPETNDDVIFQSGLSAAAKPPATGSVPAGTFKFVANSIVDGDYTIHDLQINDANYHIDAGSLPATLTITGRLLVNVPGSVGNDTGLSVLGPIFSSTVTTSNLTIQLNGVNQEFNIAGTGLLDITASLIDPATGYAGILKTGTGAIEFGGTNSYSGVTRVSAGILYVANEYALGSTIRPTIVDSGATLSVVTDDFLAEDGIANSLQITGAGFNGKGALEGSIDPFTQFEGLANNGGGLWIGGISLVGNATIGTDAGVFADGAQLVVDVNGISGSGTLTKVGAGDLSVEVASTYAGNTVINQGSLSIYDNKALGVGTGFSITVNPTGGLGASLRLDAGLNVNETLFLNGPGYDVDFANRLLGALNLLNPGASTWSGSITIQTAATIGSTLDATLTLAGALAGSASLSKVDRGTVRIARANTGFTGTTTIDNGTLDVADARAVGTGAITVNSTTGTAAEVGTLLLDGTFTLAQTVTTNGVGFGTNGAISIVNPAAGGTSNITLTNVALQSATSLHVDPNANLTIAGVISDAPGTAVAGAPLEVTGSGTLVLAGNNTYTSATVLRGGTTILKSNKALGVGTLGVSVTSGSVLDLTGGITVSVPLTVSGSTTSPARSTFGVLAGTNVWAGTATFISNGSSVAVNVAAGTNLVFSGTLSGDSDIHKTGTGTLQISGTQSNNDLGTLLIDAGMVTLGMRPATPNTTLNATGGNIVVGNGTGAAGAAVLQLAASNQISDTNAVTVNSDGLFNLNNFNETLGGQTALTLAGGRVTTGSGTLTLNGNLETNGSTGTSGITGNVSLGSATRNSGYRPTPQMTLSSNLNASQFGNAVTYTFTATGMAGEPLVTGSVNFYSGTTRIGATQILSNGTATLTTTALPGGNQPITAIYSGDNYYAPTSENMAPGQTVDNPPATETLTSSNVTATTGESVTFTFTLAGTSGSTAPTGTVAFFDGSTLIGTVQALANGTASVTTSSLAVGTHVITAVYSGDIFYASSTVTLAPVQTVGATPFVLLTSNADVITGGHTVTFTFSSSGDVGLPKPTGTVQFFVDGIPLGAAQTLSADGTATMSKSGLSLGDHLITAVYSGDSIYNGATATLPVSEVAATPFVSTLYSSANVVCQSTPANGTTPAYNNPVTFTYATSTSAGNPLPTGQVSFSASLNGVVLASGFGTLANGVATFTTIFSQTGTYTVTATYLGDNNYAGATSTLAPAEIVVAPGNYISSEDDPSLSGQNVTYVFTSNTSAGLLTTTAGTGSVVFFDNGRQISGPIGLNAIGQAQFTETQPTAGTHTITAQYTSSSGTSTVSLPTQIVDADPLSAVLVSQSEPAATGTNVTLTFEGAFFRTLPEPNPSPPPPTVNSSIPAPTGTVSFFDGSTLIGTVTLPPTGTVSISTDSLTVGSHKIFAVYSGDSNYATYRVALPVPEVIGPAPSIRIVSSADPVLVTGNVTFTVSAYGGSGQPTPTGKVTLYVDGFQLSDAISLENGVATYSVSAATLGVGSHVITADYTGDPNYATAIGTMVQNEVVVDPPPVQITTSAQPQTVNGVVTYPVTPGQSVTYTLKVPNANASAGDPAPVGTVTFTQIDSLGNSIVIGSAPLNANGVASITVFSPATVGTYTIVASYAGDTADGYEPVSVTISAPVQNTLGPVSPPPTVVNRFEPVATVNGTISGGAGAGLTSTGPGVLVLNGVNTYSGATTVNGSAGTLIVGVTGALPPGTPLAIGAGGTVDMNGNTASVADLSGAGTLFLDGNGSALTTGTDNTSTTFSGAITGTGTLTKVGNGTLTLSGASPTYTGPTFVSGGAVFVNGNQSGSAVQVASGTTLGGNGGIVGAVTVSAGGTVAPGTNGPGLLNTGAISYAAGSTFAVTLNGTTAESQYSQLDVTGTATLNGATLSLSVGFAPAVNNTFVILTATTIVGTFKDRNGNVLGEGATFDLNGRVYTISYLGNQVTLTVTGFAETSTLTSNLNPAQPGQSVTFTATYTQILPTDPAPQGSVQFYLDGATTPFATVALNGSGSASASLALAVGAHTITAVYTSTNGFQNTTTTLTESVSGVPAVALTTSASSVIFGTAVTYTAQVSGSIGTPTGTVNFYNASTGAFLGSANLDGNGFAQLTTSAVSHGTSTIQAVYTGDSNYRSGAATVTQVITSVPLYAAGSGPNGPGIVTAFSAMTGGALISFAPFGAYAGGVKVAVGDVNGDGYSDLIVMAGPGALNGLVQIYSGRDFSLLSTYFAFPGYAGEFNIAAGDLTGNGIDDVIFSTATGGDFVFAYAGASNTFIVPIFSAFGGFTGGVTIAAGDVRGSGVDQIIVGTASQVGAAGVFNQYGQLLQPYYFAPVAMNGVNVAAADLNNSGHDDIIFGARTGSTLVLEFDGVSQGLMGYFFAYPGQTFGVTVAAVDPTASGYANIVTGFTSNVSAIAIYSGLSFQLLDVNGQPSGAGGVSVAGSGTTK
ncbi:Ig-like domain repeat protein [Frigoriglobus tundricola]|uniref:Bacterial Ig-like domain-containing protein n=1 Tax=Frigoriglobus tundricola TaxID=2774151 RepID=A0A6M5YIJ6_9BACT|nr:Ig-like domain repeat protein [Frigoriglobus tundricola]QJW93086.1 hypothetical protein FTUN_0588 [Frigoriglobus tundricola]